MNNDKISSLTVGEFGDLVEKIIKDAPKDYFIEEVRVAVHGLIGIEHPDQHQFIAMLMDERKDRLARIKKIQDMIAGSLILSFILWLLMVTGSGALDWIRQIPKGH